MNCNKSWRLGIVLVVLLPVLASAGPIPDLVPPGTAPSLLPAPLMPQITPEPALSPVPPHPSPAASDYISGFRYYLEKSRPHAHPSGFTTDSGLTPEMQTRDSAVIGSCNMSTDSIPDVEPLIIAINKNGTIWTTSVFTKRSGPGEPVLIRNYFSTTSDFTAVIKGELPVPATFAFSGDPYLAANPFSTGVAPGRMYATGVLANAVSNQPSGIALWRSDDGGRTWSAPTLVASSSGTPILDKPSIGVSWHAGSLGHVYVAYVHFNSGELMIAKSTDGGIEFSDPVRITISGAEINGAQVLVNPFHGHVYVLWLDPGVKAIRMSTSTNSGQNWSMPETAASINPVVGRLNNNTGPRAPSFPIARFNTVANKIAVVWHELEQPGSSNTDVYYISRSPSGWQPAKVKINDLRLNDQFLPALDFDTTGNMIVTFYDRRNDPTNWLYQVFSARIDPNGNRLEPNQLVSAFQSDPRRHESSFIGDYQEIWSQSYSGTFYYFPAWVGIPGTTGGDIYVSAINPVAEFFDVPPSYWTYSHIKAVVTRGSMFGCGAGNFCPAALVDRKMLADYLIVGMHQIQSSAAFNAYFDERLFR